MKIILFFYQVEIKPYKISVFSEKNNKYFTIMTLFKKNREKSIAFLIIIH